VLEYVEKNDYKPSAIARGLAQSRTYNIGVVVPENYALVELPFFQEVITGIQEIAGNNEYDVLLCISQEDDIAGLERILCNRKVDGVVLLRTYVKDTHIEFLMDKGIPFVVTGSTEYPGVRQVDHDHRSACRELTSILLMRWQDRVALIGGNQSHVVTQSRYQGFAQAYDDMGIGMDENLIFMNMDGKARLDQEVEAVLAKGAACIVCMDDAICTIVLRKLRLLHVKVPDDVRVASFYNSSILENNIPSITSLSFNARELGMEACRNLLTQIEGGPTRERTLLPYEVVLKESTK
jgi:DNA-binding LacI/PurR family transcriptional regulator